MMIRYASYFIAALLPLLLFRWFAPVSVGEIDFWLLWLLAMILVALPVVYAEDGGERWHTGVWMRD